MRHAYREGSQIAKTQLANRNRDHLLVNNRSRNPKPVSALADEKAIGSVAGDPTLHFD